VNQREKRRAAERERQQAEIVAVALKAFAGAGYAGTSMNDIAAESGYSVGHIYNVVGTKSELFDAVMLSEGNLLVDRIAAADVSHADDPAGAIDAIVDAVLTFFDDHRAFFEIYLRHAAGLSANVELVFSPGLAELKKKTDGRIGQLFRRAADAGLTGPVSPSDMTIAFIELVNGFLARWATAGYRGRISRKSKAIKHLLWHGIRA
jgi:AcrR family transcriptional regulator